MIGLLLHRTSWHPAQGAPDASAATILLVGDVCAMVAGAGLVHAAFAQALTWSRGGVGIVNLSQSRTQPGVNSGTGPLVAMKLAGEEGPPSALGRKRPVRLERQVPPVALRQGGV